MIGGTVVGVVLLFIYLLSRSRAPENGPASSGTDALDAGLSGLLPEKFRADMPGLVSGTAGTNIAAPAPKSQTAAKPAKTTTPSNFNLPSGHFEFEHAGDVGHFVTDEVASLSGRFKVTDIQNFSTHKTVYYNSVDASGNNSGATQTKDVALGGPIPLIGSIFSGFGNG